MDNFVLSADQARLLASALKRYPVDRLNAALYLLAKDLPEVERKFYEDEIRVFGWLGSKAAIVTDLIDLISPLGEEAANAIIAVLDERADNRYKRESPEEHSEYAPWQYKEQEPGTPGVLPESEIITPKPRPFFNAETGEWEYPDRYSEELRQGFRKGPPPVAPATIPDFASMDEGALDQWRSMLRAGLTQTVQILSREHVAEMAYQYLKSIDSPDAFEFDLTNMAVSKSPDPNIITPVYRFRNIDKTKQPQTWNYTIPNIIDVLMQHMTLEDAYVYWYSLYNRVVPWVNLDYVDAYFESATGRDLRRFHDKWEETPVSTVAEKKHEDLVVMPEDVPYVEFSEPEWYQHVEGYPPWEYKEQEEKDVLVEQPYAPTEPSEEKRVR